MLAARFAGLVAADERRGGAWRRPPCNRLCGHFRVEHWKQRPFRSPHHTASGVALVGGGSIPRPGEISLAHCGVLFLDELPEFDRARARSAAPAAGVGPHHHFARRPAGGFSGPFQLVAAMNPCPCGYLGHPAAPAVARRTCQPLPAADIGPLLDRIDMQIESARWRRRCSAPTPTANRGPRSPPG